MLLAMLLVELLAAPRTPECVAETTHGVTFAAVVSRGRVHGVQFHPEKSGPAGVRILRNFVAIPPFLAEAARVLRDGGRIALLEVATPRSAVVRAAHQNGANVRGKAVSLCARGKRSGFGRDHEAQPV